MIYTVVALLVLYMILWMYLFAGQLRLQHEAVRAFKNAWEDDTYTVSTVSSYRDSLRGFTIEFTSGNGSRVLECDHNGKLLSGIRYGRNAPLEKPSRWLRRQLEDTTAQIATMYKLEYDIPDGQ